jgi:hypothetical protein
VLTEREWRADPARDYGVNLPMSTPGQKGVTEGPRGVLKRSKQKGPRDQRGPSVVSQYGCAVSRESAGLRDDGPGESDGALVLAPLPPKVRDQFCRSEEPTQQE